MAAERRLRVVHAAGQLRASAGIEQQMLWEQEAADALDLDWTSMLIRPKGVSGSSSRVLHEIELRDPGHDLRTWIAFRRRFYALLASLDPTPDVLLLRHNVHDPFEARFIASHRNVVTVHHTIEDAEILALGGRAAPVKRRLERHFGARSLRSAAGIAGLTPEILAHERSRRVNCAPATFVYPNGRLLDDALPIDRRDGLRLAFVASEFAPWQGLEGLLDRLAASTADIALDVVGSLSAEQERRCAKDPRVRVHGLLDQKALRDVLAAATAGIAALRADGKGLTQACSLKVRDYLAAGVPVVSGHDDVFPDDFPYYRRTGTDIEAILAAAHQWRSVDRATVREAARPHIDKVELVRRLHGELVAAFASADN